NLSPRVAVDGPFERALVEVDEESRGHYGAGRAFLAFQKLKRARDCVGSARAQLALVVARGKSGPQVGLGRQRLGQPWRRLVTEVALVGNVSDPTEALDAHRGVSLTATASGGRRPSMRSRTRTRPQRPWSHRPPRWRSAWSAARARHPPPRCQGPRSACCGR